MTSKEKLLEVRDLRVSFRTGKGMVKAVRGVSFALERGETLAIVGESGSGKSVTARAVMGLLAGNGVIECGEISYGGMDLTKLGERKFSSLRGSRLAMIFQDPSNSLNPIIRVGRQLTEAIIANSKTKKREARRTFGSRLKSVMVCARAVPGGAETVTRFKKTAMLCAAFHREHARRLEQAAEAAWELREALELVLNGEDAKALKIVRRTVSKVRRQGLERAEGASASLPVLLDALEAAVRLSDKNCERDGLISALVRAGEALEDESKRPATDFFIRAYTRLFKGGEVEAGAFLSEFIALADKAMSEPRAAPPEKKEAPRRVGAALPPTPRTRAAFLCGNVAAMAELLLEAAKSRLGRFQDALPQAER
jgi:Fe-S cluster assembly ATPase SufC